MPQREFAAGTRVSQRARESRDGHGSLAADVRATMQQLQSPDPLVHEPTRRAKEVEEAPAGKDERLVLTCQVLS